MEDLVKEALKLDPHHILDIPGRPVDNSWIFTWETLEVLDIKSVSVQLLNVIIKTSVYPFMASYKDSKGTIHKCALMIDGNTMDEMMEIITAIENEQEIQWMFSGYTLPRNEELIDMECLHGKFDRK